VSAHGRRGEPVSPMPMPIAALEQLRMLGRCPELFIHPVITAAGVPYPAAMFSPEPLV